MRAARGELVDDHERRGVDFGLTLAQLLDGVLRDALRTVERTSGWAIVALGSYARRELTPGSDIDVMLMRML